MAGQSSIGSLAGADTLDEPAPRFAFGSVLGQAATSAVKVATAIDGVPVANPNSITVRPGQEVRYRITGHAQSSLGADVADLFDASLTCLFDTGQCFPGSLAEIGGPPPLLPANLGGVLVCSPVLFGTNRSFDFIVVFRVNSTISPHTDASFNVACVEGSAAIDVFNQCVAVGGMLQGPTPTPTVSPSPTAPIVPIALVAPSLPPPPPLFAPPPPPPLPPPLLAPPSRGPMGPQPPQGPSAAVPVIPEADSLWLLLGGFAGLGLLALRRLRRSPRNDA